MKESAKYPGIPSWLDKFTLFPMVWKGARCYFGILPVSIIEPNTGQVSGLPSNPREWTRTDLDYLKKSIEETPELTLARGVLSYPLDNKKMVVALGGNMRHAAALELKETDIPAAVFPIDTTPEKLMEIVMKDNGTFGRFDWDKVANEWSDLPLPDWGVPAWDTDAGSGEGGNPGGGFTEAQEDDFDENEDEIHVRCKPGDIWELGEHRLMCGDSTDLETVKKLMGGGCK